MRDFLSFVKADLREFVGNPRTKAECSPLLRDGCANYALEALRVRLNEKDIDQLSDLVLKNIADIKLLKNVADKFSLKKAVPKLFAQKAYAYAFKYYYRRVREMQFYDHAFCKDFNYALVTLEDRKKLLGELWFHA